jgi:hypothetical protein
MDRLNLKKLNEVEGKERYRIEISKRFAALENLDTEVDVNKARETIGENIKNSAKKREVIMNRRRINHGLMKDAQNY